MKRERALVRLGAWMTDLSVRYFPDAFVFALIAVAAVFLFGLILGEPPATLVRAFGGGFWVLVPFTMQMALIIITGFVVASSRPVSALIVKLAGIPKTPRGAVGFVALFALLTSLISWGFALVFAGLLVREIVRRVNGVDYRAIGAAAYLAVGAVWTLGLSSSAALMQATKSAIPSELLPITGVVPLTQTIFLWQNLLLAAVLIILGVAVAYFSAPSAERSQTAEQMGVQFEPLTIERETPRTPAEKLEDSPILTIAIVALMFSYLMFQISEKGALTTLDLNNFNFMFLAFGMLLQWRPRSFLKAVGRSVPAVSGVLIQFPFYAGIFGLISKTSMGTVLADFFVTIANRHTFLPILTIYSMVLDLFIPSGGGKWVVEAPYVMQAARALRLHLGWTIQTYGTAEGLANLMNPFWMLPLMGILNVRARDLAGYSILQLLCHAPVVLLMTWLLSYTLPYVPPILG
jgi:short-chain fatty acids transporter